VSSSCPNSSPLLGVDDQLEKRQEQVEEGQPPSRGVKSMENVSFGQFSRGTLAEAQAGEWKVCREEAQPCPSGETVCKVLLGEAKGRNHWAGEGEGKGRSGRPRTWISPGLGLLGKEQASQAPCFLLGLCQLPAVPSPRIWASATLRTQRLANPALQGCAQLTQGGCGDQEEG
jgi:hypothetical protein